MKPTIFILGQSIGLQWGAFLQEQLGEQFLYQHKTGREEELEEYPELQRENGGTSSDVLQYLQLRKNSLHPTMLVVGAGLHDIKKATEAAPAEVGAKKYHDNLLSIINQYINSESQLVWMTTTMFDQRLHNTIAPNFYRYMVDNEEYHQIATSLMKEHNIPILDIRDFTKELTKGMDISEVYVDHIHFKEPIRQAQAIFVANWIKAF